MAMGLLYIPIAMADALHFLSYSRNYWTISYFFINYFKILLVS